MLRCYSGVVAGSPAFEQFSVEEKHWRDWLTRSPSRVLHVIRQRELPGRAREIQEHIKARYYLANRESDETELYI